LPNFSPTVLKTRGDFLVLGHVARQDQRVRAERAGEFLDVFLDAFALVGEGEFRARPCAHAWAMAQAMERLLATPKTIPVFPSSNGISDFISIRISQKSSPWRFSIPISFSSSTAMTGSWG
jgi:hypothetical protein